MYEMNKVSKELNINTDELKLKLEQLAFRKLNEAVWKIRLREINPKNFLIKDDFMVLIPNYIEKIENPDYVVVVNLNAQPKPIIRFISVKRFYKTEEKEARLNKVKEIIEKAGIGW